MDKLKQCLNTFTSMMGKDYYLKLEGGFVMKIFFAKKHFHHLIGLQKLKDIPPLIVNKDTNSTTTIYNNIKNDRITYAQISKSAFFSEISERIDNFSKINNLIFEKVIINFDKNKVPSAPNYIPLIKAEYILYKKNRNDYFHLCLGDTNNTNTIATSNTYYPETFLVQHDDYYVVGQTELKVEHINIEQPKTKSKKNTKQTKAV